jgi:glycosyltransferase involved in cell wall biosynthesis
MTTNISAGENSKRTPEQQIVCFGAAEWSGMYARAQQLMTRFAAAGYRVLYVNPPITWLSPLKKPQYWKGRVFRITKFEEISPGIFVYTPPPLLPFANLHPGINKLNQYFLAQGLKDIYRTLKFSDPLLWTYLPNNVDILKHLRHSLLIYDCADEHASFPGFINPQTVSKMENRLLGRADFVFASAQELYNKRVKICPHIRLINNGADFGHFQQAFKEMLPIPEDIAALPKPIAGYIGAISTWLDLELLQGLATAYPQWSIVMIGPQDIDLTTLKNCQNIFWLGPKPYSMLPSYLQRFDLCLIPFVINDLTVNVNPVKLYEYLAAGKPVLTTALPEVRQFSNYIAIAETKADFVTLAAREISANNNLKSKQRQEIALANSWDLRFKEMLAVILDQSYR